MSRDKSPTDRDLGMDRNIPRRDFIQGALAGAAAALAAPWGSAFGLEAGAGRRPVPAAAAAAQDQPGYYPPLLTACAAAIPDPSRSRTRCATGSRDRPRIDTGETYDLVVVGGGISGLAAAYFFRRATANASASSSSTTTTTSAATPSATNFTSGRMLLLNGGTLAIDSPAALQRRRRRTDQELGVDVAALQPQGRPTEVLRWARLANAACSSTRRPSERTSWSRGCQRARHVRKFLADARLSARPRATSRASRKAASTTCPG